MVDVHQFTLLTQWGRLTHIRVSRPTTIGSDNGLLPPQRQAIIWNNAAILFFRSLGTTFSEIEIEMHMFSFQKMYLKMSYGKWRPFCLGPNVFIILNAMKEFIARNKTGQLHPSSPHLTTEGFLRTWQNLPDSKVHGANMGPIWGRQDPGGPHVGPVNFDIWA